MINKPGKSLLALLLSSALLTGTVFSARAAASSPDTDISSAYAETENIFLADTSDGADFSDAEAVDIPSEESGLISVDEADASSETDEIVSTLFAGESPDEIVSNEAAAAFHSTEAHDGYLIELNKNGLASLCGDSPDADDTLSTDSLQAVWDNIYRADDKDIIIALLNSGFLTHIEPNYTFELMEDTSATTESWPYALVGADYSSRYALTGNGLRIGVIDSGADLTNVNLQGANIVEGYNYVAKSTEMTDVVYHGTKAIQMIAGNGKDGAIRGVAPGAEIVPLKAFSDTGATAMDQLLQAVYDAVDVYHCDIINMSWGMKSDSELLHEAMQYASSQGVILLAASGNVSSSMPQGTTVYPAAYEEVIGIGNVDSQMVVSDSSMQSEAVMFTAPGKNIPFLDRSGSLINSSGTSFACPCAAGLIADLLQAMPQKNYTRLIELMRNRAIDLGSTGYDVSYGYGFLNIEEILSQPMIWTDSAESGTTVSGYWCGDQGGRLVLSDYLSDGKMGNALVTLCDSNGFCSYSMSLVLSADSVRLCLFTLTGSGAIGEPMVSLPVNH